jgi:hypothetical protein
MSAGGSTTFPLVNLARIKSTNVTMAPIPRIETFVYKKGIEETGIYAIAERIIVPMRAQTVKVSNEKRRAGITDDCGGMITTDINE